MRGTASDPVSSQSSTIASDSGSGDLGVSGIILAGGSSSRLGQDKALSDVAGQAMIERVVERLQTVVDEIVLVTDAPEQFAFLGLPMIGDVYRGIGTLGGLHAGLRAIHAEYGLVVGCDMPFLNPGLLRYLISWREGNDIVMPRVGRHHEPLHAIYAKHCLPVIEQSVAAGKRRILHACVGLNIHYVEEELIATLDPLHLSFFNVNTPGDLKRMNQIMSVTAREGSSPDNLHTKEVNRRHDEVSELAEAFDSMSQELQRQSEELSTLNALTATVSQSLNLTQVLDSALDEVLRLMRGKAGWVTLRDGHGGEPCTVASRGLSKSVLLAHARCDWNRSLCAEIFESGQSRVFDGAPGHSCPATESLWNEGIAFLACIPLRSKDRVLGVMSLVGDAASNSWAFVEDSLETLTAIGRQVGVAIENARLYEELHRKETLGRQLLERGIVLQEEERRRIARELHDRTSQSLASILMMLGVLDQANSLAEVRMHVQGMRDTVAQTLDEVHNLVLELRPRVLDDLGLLAALRHFLGELRDRFRIPIDFEVLGLGDERLPSRVETALYRITQEALINVTRHAHAQNVAVLLENRGTAVVLIVEDDGRGFDVTQVMDSQVSEKNLGLHGMRERALLCGGTLTIESAPGTGTAIFVEIPLKREESDRENDPFAGG